MKHRAKPRLIVRSRLIGLAVCATAVALAVLPLTAGSTTSAAAGTAATGTTAKPRIFAYYYLWWSLDHWKNSLGSQYPTTASPLPLPATLDASGCSPKTLYSGNVLTDVPSRLYSQDDPGFIEADVRQAAAAGLSGFMVNWAGSGTANQTVTSTP